MTDWVFIYGLAVVAVSMIWVAMIKTGELRDDS